MSCTLRGMGNSALAWLIAALAVLAAGAFGRLWQQRGTAVAEAASERDALREKVSALEAQLGKRQGKTEKRGEELAELRRKLEKARKRAAQAKEELAPTAERVRELEATVARRDDELRSLRSERSAATPEAAAPVLEAAAAEAETQAHAEAAAREAMRVRAESAEGKAGEQAEALAEATKQVERLRVRVRNQDMLYASLRSELDVKNDRIKQQREELERMQALKVALVDTPADTPAEVSAPRPDADADSEDAPASQS